MLHTCNWSSKKWHVIKFNFKSKHFPDNLCRMKANWKLCLYVTWKTIRKHVSTLYNSRLKTFTTRHKSFWTSDVCNETEKHIKARFYPTDGMHLKAERWNDWKVNILLPPLDCGTTVVSCFPRLCYAFTWISSGKSLKHLLF